MNEPESADGVAGSPRPRISAEFVIYSDARPADDISKHLGIDPTRTAVKGIRIGKHTGRPINVPRHMWQLSSEPNVTKQDLSSHMDWLLARLLPLTGRLQEIRDSGAELRLICRLWTSGTSAHIRISTSAMENLLKLDLELQMEFADYGPDEQPARGRTLAEDGMRMLPPGV